MLKTALGAATLVALTLTAAHAQTRPSVHAGYSPGTVGAMEGPAQGLAVNADDVAMQQAGRSTTAEGGRRLQPVSETAGYSAGTVGAAPGH